MSNCYFDITANGSPMGRITFKLYDDVVPNTTANFRALCTGEKGMPLSSISQLISSPSSHTPLSQALTLNPTTIQSSRAPTNAPFLPQASATKAPPSTA